MQEAKTSVDRKQDVLVALASGAGSYIAAAEACGLHRNTVSKYLASDPVFKAQAERLLGKRTRRTQSLPRATTAMHPGEFPDFLTFRERFFKRKNFWYHADAYRQITDHDRLVMLVPPMHAKTMIWSIEYSAYEIFKSAATDPTRSVRITVIQKSQEEAIKVVGAVQARLTDHGFYQSMGIPLEEDPITLYGGELGFKPRSYQTGKKWGAEAFYIAGQASGEKDPTMQAKGVGGTIIGNRAYIIVVDDPQDPKTSSPSEVDGMVRYMQQAVLSRAPVKLILLGSRIGQGDFWSRVLDEEWSEGWPVIKYPAILDWDTKKLLCPDIWTWDTPPFSMMRAKKEAGPYWYSTWMQEEGEIEHAVFKKVSIDAAKDLIRSLAHSREDIPSEVTHVAIGCDPAISNYCAIQTRGLDVRTGKRYIIDLFDEKNLRTFGNIQKVLIALAERFGPKVVVVEKASTQESITNDEDFARAIRALGARLLVYPTRTAMGARAENDDFDISILGDLYDSGLVVLPYGDAETRRKVDSYTSQLMEWRPGVKHIRRDQLMAELMAESALIDIYLRSKNRKPTTRITHTPAWVKGRMSRWQKGEEFRPRHNPALDSQRVVSA